MKISKEVETKAKNLVKEGKVKKEIETEKRIHFKVQGETEVHSVIFNKEKNEWECDCPFSTLKEKECSHIVACKLFLKNKKED
jgi:hypothetical protein